MRGRVAVICVVAVIAATPAARAQWTVGDPVALSPGVTSAEPVLPGAYSAGIAFGGGVHLVAWSAPAGVTSDDNVHELRVARFAEDGTLLDPTSRVLDAQPYLGDAAVASDGSRFLVVWLRVPDAVRRELMSAIVDASGDVVAGPTMLASDAPADAPLSVGWHGRYEVAWTDSAFALHHLALDADGATVLADEMLASVGQIVWTACDDATCRIGWQDCRSGPTCTASRVRMDADGSEHGEPAAAGETVWRLDARTMLVVNDHGDATRVDDSGAALDDTPIHLADPSFGYGPAVSSSGVWSQYLLLPYTGASGAHLLAPDGTLRETPWSHSQIGGMTEVGEDGGSLLVGRPMRISYVEADGLDDLGPLTLRSVVQAGPSAAGGGTDAMVAWAEVAQIDTTVWTAVVQHIGADGAPSGVAATPFTTADSTAQAVRVVYDGTAYVALASDTMVRASRWDGTAWSAPADVFDPDRFYAATAGDGGTLVVDQYFGRARLLTAAGVIDAEDAFPGVMPMGATGAVSNGLGYLVTFAAGSCWYDRGGHVVHRSLGPWPGASTMIPVGGEIWIVSSPLIFKLDTAGVERDTVTNPTAQPISAGVFDGRALVFAQRAADLSGFDDPPIVLERVALDGTPLATANVPVQGHASAYSTSPIALTRLDGTHVSLTYSDWTLDGGTASMQIVERILTRDDLCVSDSECDDGDACTTDVCTDGSCVYAGIDGCCLVDYDCPPLVPDGGGVCMAARCVMPDAGTPDAGAADGEASDLGARDAAGTDDGVIVPDGGSDLGRDTVDAGVPDAPGDATTPTDHASYGCCSVAGTSHATLVVPFALATLAIASRVRRSRKRGLR